MRTLLDNQTANRPERRTARLAIELARHNVEIAALSEICLANKSQLTEIGVSFTFFWSGRYVEERHEAGVVFAIKATLNKNSRLYRKAPMTVE